ncbi:hypothetical protein Celaphus_00016712 [Cervus elaphus hippelaphus]|uniref:Uncharacterized protein n=1 Tax=Cervus elaphus hippelaphus TaxID=46360 RepID=A0A212C436_CEREH|nr:hypothetical protein Celaphus_00016712 [Cervus elaphus hippelaphus]
MLTELRYCINRKFHSNLLPSKRDIWGGTVGSEQPGFTDADLYTAKLMYRQGVVANFRIQDEEL